MKCDICGLKVEGAFGCYGHTKDFKYTGYSGYLDYTEFLKLEIKPLYYSTFYSYENVSLLMNLKNGDPFPKSYGILFAISSITFIGDSFCVLANKKKRHNDPCPENLIWTIVEKEIAEKI